MYNIDLKCTPGRNELCKSTNLTLDGPRKPSLEANTSINLPEKKHQKTMRCKTPSQQRKRIFRNISCFKDLFLQKQICSQGVSSHDRGICSNNTRITQSNLKSILCDNHRNLIVINLVLHLERVSVCFLNSFLNSQINLVFVKNRKKIL